MSSTIKSKMQDLKRDLILEEASLLFESKGFEELKVSELAKTVGVSVGTIYGMFESKEGLYMAYVRKQIASYVEEMERQFESIESADEQLRMAFQLKFEHFTSNRKAIEDCVKNNPLFFSNVRNNSTDMLADVYAKLTDIIAHINPRLGADGAQKLAYACVGLSDGYISHWLIAEDDLLSQLEPMFQRMMLMIKGCE